MACGAGPGERCHNGPVPESSTPSELFAGRYALGAELGRGGMGSVVLARDTVLDREVAIKRLHLNLAGDDAVVERFRREARAIARLNHPHVVTIHDLGTSGGDAFMVMQRLPGPDLQRRVVESGGGLPVADVLRWGAQAADALEAAHAQGILHRDVKPSNLVLDAHGSVQVVDFGIAALEDEQGITTTAGYIGTPAYSAPERARFEPATRASDLYALGCTLFMLLAGRPPFEGPNALLQHLNAPAPAIATLRPDVPPALAQLVDQLLAKDPARRPASAGEVRDRLRATSPAGPAFADAPVPPATLAELAPAPDATVVAPAEPVRALRPGRRLRLMAIAGGSVLTLLAGLAFFLPGLAGGTGGTGQTGSGGAGGGVTSTSARPSASASASKGSTKPTGSATPSGGTLTSRNGLTYRLHPGGTSAYLAGLLGNYRATITSARLEGDLIVVGFTATGPSDLRHPRESCLVIESGGAERTLMPVSTALTKNASGDFAGLWSFPDPGIGRLGVRYSCRADYTTAALGEIS